MTDISSNQDRILYQIKRLGPQPAKSLALHLGITTMAIRQHLSALESHGLVAAMPPEPQNRGRPLTRWKLSGAGHARFPDAHAQVTSELISGIRDQLGEGALDKVIEQRARTSLNLYRKALEHKTDLPARLKELARLRTEEGYMAEIEKVSDERYLLIEQHCPICVAAESCQGFCRAEIDTFRELFDGMARIERQEYLLDGARRCTYLVTAVARR